MTPSLKKGRLVMTMLRKSSLFFTVILVVVTMFAYTFFTAPTAKANSLNFPQNCGTLTITTAARPALAGYNGNLYVAWTGMDSAHHLNLAYSSDGLCFSNKVTNLPSETSPANDGPALAVYNSKLYLAWTGTDSSHHLNIMAYNGTSFTTYSALSDTSPYSPTLATYASALYIGWTGSGSTHSLNVNWSTSIPNFNSKYTLPYSSAVSGPTLAHFSSASKLALAWVPGDNTIRIAHLANGAWSNISQVPNADVPTDEPTLNPGQNASLDLWYGALLSKDYIVQQGSSDGVNFTSASSIGVITSIGQAVALFSGSCSMCMAYVDTTTSSDTVNFVGVGD